MSTFHDEIAGRIERHLKDRRVVVLYDPRREYEPFIDDLVARGDGERVSVGGTPAWLGRFDGSYLKLRHEAERRMGSDEPRHGLVYVPGQERDRKRSPLMELDQAGHTYEPQLRRVARDILRERFSDGQIDGFLEPAGVGYRDIAAYFDQGSADTSILRMLYGSVGSEGILSQWILDDSRDAELVTKGAVPEFRTLVRTRVGLEAGEGAPLSSVRRDLLRYLLVNEFRMDLGGTPPGSLDLIPEPTQKEQRDRIRAIAAELRRADPAAYSVLADGVEADLGLAGLSIEASRLGAVDTFRFEEQRLLEEAAQRLADGDHAAALTLARGREDSHWVRSNPRRLAQWSALQEAAVLAQRVASCLQEVARLRGKAPSAWIQRYTAEGGWAEVDGLDRRLAAFLSAMDEEPVAGRAITRVRQGYSEWVRLLNEAFTGSLVAAGWDAGWELHQTQVFDHRVRPDADPVAFFVVDAFRFEMGQELVKRLGEQAAQVTLDAAMAALPTITPVGMAALLPGASESFSVQAAGSGIAGAIGGEAFAAWPARWQHLQRRLPGSVELRLETLLHMTEEAIAEAVRGARLVLVRSQDIDAVGEAGVGLLAQQAMGPVIPNLARAMQRLNRAGIHRSIVASDHGHLLDQTQEDDMKIESPGGDTVDMHRRCWAGRGGRTPSGAVRVTGANLGYDTDLDFIFPSGRGVFRSGGGLRYHHGGLSLQEVVIPVISVTMARHGESAASGARVLLYDVPERITNRTLGVRVELARDLFSEPHWVRVVFLDQSEQVGEAGMAQGATLDSLTRRIQLVPGQVANIGLMLSRDDCKTVKVVVLDAETEAVLAQSKTLNVSLSI